MGAQIIEGNFADELKSRYLTYAMSTIMSRALPDVRDGLKPVHRRVLYAMRMMKLDPEKGYKKSARVVGDVIGKYHPHGDASVYDAMVRLSQNFSLRYPMVDGQGNFGSVDGDGPAAMRYTEAKLTSVAAWIMKDLENGTVDFQDNYDESESEPMVMPGCFPNLLANGGSGIAVGLSTSIPPHNVTELCAGLVALLKTPTMRDETMLNYVKGPDFPLGGVLVEKAESIAAAYATGRGSFRLRAKWEKVDLGKGQYEIVVTEIPYQVQKGRLIEKIADLINSRKTPWLTDVRDESDENIRVVLEPKNRNVDAQALMESLFRLSDLETKVSLNMNVITSYGTPACLSLKDAMQQFLEHRRVVLIRKSKWRSKKIQDRLHILDAYRVVYLNINEVIEIIKNNDQPLPIMMERFGIDEIQGNAILDMRLRRLRKLEEMEIGREYDELSKELFQLQDILASEETQTQTLIEEMKAIKKEFGDDRRTVLADAPVVSDIPMEAQVEKEPITVLLSKQGWVKALKGHMEAGQEARYKEGDAEAFRVPCQTVDQLCVLGSSGKVFTVSASKLPTGRGFGEPLRLQIDMQAEETIQAFFLPEAKNYLVATKKGYGFILEHDKMMSQTRSGKQILNLAKGDEAQFCVPAVGNMVAVASAENRVLTFALSEMPVMTRGKGVRLMNLKGHNMEDICVFSSGSGLGFTNGVVKDRVVTDLATWHGKRTQVGKVAPHGFQKEIGFFVPEGTVSVDEKSTEEIVGDLNKVADKAEPTDITELVNAAVKGRSFSDKDKISEDAEVLDLFADLDDE